MQPFLDIGRGKALVLIRCAGRDRIGMALGVRYIRIKAKALAMLDHLIEPLQNIITFPVPAAAEVLTEISGNRSLEATGHIMPWLGVAVLYVIEPPPVEIKPPDEGDPVINNAEFFVVGGGIGCQPFADAFTEIPVIIPVKMSP